MPTATLLPAVTWHELPAAAVVLQEMTVLPAVQLLLADDGVTVIRFHVVAAPEYE